MHVRDLWSRRLAKGTSFSIFLRVTSSRYSTNSLRILCNFFCSSPIHNLELQCVSFNPCIYIQVEASTNQVVEQQVPAYDLPEKILCRVLNVQLKVRACGHIISLQVLQRHI